MFTVKQIIEKATSFYQMDELTIGRKGSEQYRQALDLAKSLNVENPCVIEHIPSTYSDPECKEVIYDENLLVVNRNGRNINECVAVIITDKPCSAFPSIKELGGIGYQFIYSGDQVYIMNKDGATIEVVK